MTVFVVFTNNATPTDGLCYNLTDSSIYFSPNSNLNHANECRINIKVEIR